MGLFLKLKDNGKLVLAESKQFAGYLFVCTEDNTILLARRSKNEQNMPFYYEGFGGSLDAGENVEEAAKREVIEEGGSFPQIKHIMKKVVNDIPGGRGIYTMFIADISPEEKERWKIKLSKEHDDYEWFKKLPQNVHPALLKELKELA